MNFKNCLAGYFIYLIAILVAPPLYGQVSPTTQTQPGSTTQTLNPIPSAYGSGVPLNIIRAWDAEMPFISDTALSSTIRTVQQVKQTTQYLDGLGRPLETVIKGISPNGYDMVSPELYDQYGRQTLKYLSYVSPTNDGNFKANPFGEQSAFMSGFYNPANASNGEQFFYSQTVFESSPLDRITNGYAQGNSWVGSAKGQSIQYLINTTSDSVQQWQITPGVSFQVNISNVSGGNETVTYSWSNLPSGVSTILCLYQVSGATGWSIADVGGPNNGPLSGNIPAGTYNFAIQLYFNNGNPTVVINQSQNGTLFSYTDAGTYATGSLYKTVTTDENNNQVIEFKDMRGLVLLKKVQAGAVASNAPYTNWLCTYYIYDDNGNLRYVIPPNAVNLLWASNWTGLTNSTIGTGYCFQYSYDGKGRMVTKNVPGTGTVYMVYDARDRLIMIQDSLQRSLGNWMYTSYDSLNRPILTGVWNNANNQAYQQAQAYNSLTYPAPASNNTVLTQTFYDDYSWVSGSGTGLSSSFISTNTSNTTFFYTASDITFPYPRALTASTSTRGMVTGNKVNVVGSTTYLGSVNFYDDRARLIQTQNTNYSGGIDTLTIQYGFTGKILRTLEAHAKGGNNILGFEVLTKTFYDAAGRVIAQTKKVGNSFEDTLASNGYDELGQLSLKKLGQQRVSLANFAYTANPSSPIDTLRYTYNIRGWLRGINKDYANAANSATNWFGMELNYDFGFSQNQYNGNIAGIKWRNGDDGQQRAYGFTYDPVNRLTKSDFTQLVSGGGNSWNTSAGIDFSVHSITYDANGNILTLNQMGLVVNTPQLIDSLVYGYNSNSNQLNYVTDKVNFNDTSAHLGDFTEKVNNTSQDYTYDGNGNLTEDNNKSISYIHYNYLNLADSIVFTGKGYIKYVYDAAGGKQQKVTIDNTINKRTTTTYLGQFIYQRTAFPATSTSGLDTLQFISQEEGRIRPKTVNKSDTVLYDFFEKDHLGNIRTVLTDEQEQDVYPAATLENTAGINLQGQYYSINQADTISTARIASWSNTSGNNYPNNNGNPPYNTDPNVNTSAVSTVVYRLNGATGDKTGLGITIKVMAGDLVNIYGKSFYHLNTGQTPNNNYLFTSVLSSFIGAFASTPAVIAADNGAATSSVLNASSATNSGVSNWLNGIPNPSSGSVPRAYINWILFDEQFKPVASNCGYDGVSTTADNVKTHSDAVSISRGGYLYVYCSNESNIDVFFDNLQIVDTRGSLVETDNYYPFGLTMAGISSKAAGKLENKYKYNGKEHQHQEFSDGSGLEWYDYEHRMYDSQIGRFFTQDMIIDSFPSFSPYQYAKNNPILYMDINGDSAWSVKREWNKSDIKGFADYSQKKLNEMVDDKNVKLDCADAVLTVLIGYASENGLALQLQTEDGKTVFNSNSDDYSSIDDYKAAVLPGLQADDISSNTFEVLKKDAQSGDMMILTAPHNHIAAYSDIDSPTDVEKRNLVYGNLSGEGKPTGLKKTQDWSNSTSGGIKYKPNKNTAHRWNVLKF